MRTHMSTRARAHIRTHVTISILGFSSCQLPLLLSICRLSAAAVSLSLSLHFTTTTTTIARCCHHNTVTTTIAFGHCPMLLSSSLYPMSLLCSLLFCHVRILHSATTTNHHQPPPRLVLSIFNNNMHIHACTRAHAHTHALAQTSCHRFSARPYTTHTAFAFLLFSLSFSLSFSFF